MVIQKGLAPILVILLLAAAVGGYFIYQKQVRPAPVQQTVQPSPSPVDETANWKTVTGNEWLFKYPPEFEKREKMDGDIQIIDLVGGSVAGSIEKFRFIIEPLKTSSPESESNFIQTQKYDYYGPEWRIYSGSSKCLPGECDLNTHSIIVTDKSRKFTVVTLKSRNRSMIPYILGTFKLLDQNDSTPEGVTRNFYQWYTACVKDRTEDCKYENQSYVSSKLKENVSAQGGSGYDHIICAQNTVDIARVDKASISGNTAKVIVHELPYDEGITVELKLIDNQWKINNIICPQKN